MLHNNKLGRLDIFEYLSNCKLKTKKRRDLTIKKMIFIKSISYRRGLATVVTSAIILSAVSIMGVMLLGYSNTTLLSHQMEIEEVFSTQLNKINEDLFFENIWFAPPSLPKMTENHLNVTLSNIGILGLNVTTIRVTNVTAGNTTSFDYPGSGNYYTDMGIPKSTTLSKNVTYPWQSGDELDVLVFTGRGNQFITQVVVP